MLMLVSYGVVNCCRREYYLVRSLVQRGPCIYTSPKIISVVVFPVPGQDRVEALAEGIVLPPLDRTSVNMGRMQRPLDVRLPQTESISVDERGGEVYAVDLFSVLEMVEVIEPVHGFEHIGVGSSLHLGLCPAEGNLRRMTIFKDRRLAY
jgi:hypothetical protein